MNKLKWPIIIIITVITLNFNNIILKIDSLTTGYPVNILKVLKEEDNYQEIMNNTYSKTLDKAISEDKYNEEYLNIYLNVAYIDKDNFIDNVNALAKLGYNGRDINNINQKLDNEKIKIIINSPYNKDISNYLNYPYFKEDNLERYLQFQNNPNKLSFSPFYNNNIILTSEDIITFVNANLDSTYYQNDINLTEEDSEKLDVIVNKYYKLDNNYIPSDLEEINSKYTPANKQEMRHQAKVAFEKMAESALQENIKIYAGSTYRSYDYQKKLYEKYVAKDGFNRAETFSARAGYSEHQTGLAVDILNSGWHYLDENDIEYSWLINNCYKYGFILRYPRGKEYITGYTFEDWHFRYLGEELATKVYNSNLTYDEYVARYN